MSGKTATGRAMCLAVLIALAGTAADSADDHLWMRDPAISPDGTTIAFSFQGDIYTVPATGGRAIPLTRHTAYDGHPVWSRDGTAIAFASDRYGNFDIFAMPAEGGPAMRLTHYSTDDIPADFSSDNTRVLFSSPRVDSRATAQFPTPGLPELYSVSLKGGTPRMELTTPAMRARFDRTGTRLLYHDKKSLEDPLRKHHTSSIARDIWLYEKSSGAHTKLTDFEGEDRNPVWADDEIFFLSERSGSFNIWSMPLDGKGDAKQITTHANHPVRSLSRSANGLLAYSYHGLIYTVQPRETPKRLTIQLRTDRQDTPGTVSTNPGIITEMAVSPNGKEVAFIVRGEVFVTSVDFETTTRITDTPEQERSVSFSEDGRALLYAGQRNGSWNIYETRLADEDEPYFFRATTWVENALLATDSDTFQPVYSPDGTEIAFLSVRTELQVMTLADKGVRTVVPGSLNFSYEDGDLWFDWSPDGQWLALHYPARGRLFWYNIGIVPADGSRLPVDISVSGYDDWFPQWSLEGNALTWVSTRFGRRSHAQNADVQHDVMAAFLNGEAFEKFHLSGEERSLQADAEAQDEDADGGHEGDDATGKPNGEKTENDAIAESKRRLQDNGDGGDEDNTVVPINIDWDKIKDHTVRLTALSAEIADYRLTPDGNLLVYLAKTDGAYNLWLHDFRQQKTEQIVQLDASMASLDMTPDGSAIFVLSDGSMAKVDLQSDDAIAISALPEMIIRRDEERAHLFDHVWRLTRQKFYDAALHGVDWEFYRSEYRKKLASIDNNRDFAILMSEMLGELNASHTGVNYAFFVGGTDDTAALGAFYDSAYEGPGVRIAEILDKGPLTKSGLRIKPGMIITAVDGVEVTPETNFFALLNRKANKRVRLRIDPGKNGEVFEEVVRPFGIHDEMELLYRRWVARRGDLVERLSGGRLGYVHIRNMNDSSFREVYSDVLGRHYDKEALVVDTRFNGGGDLVDDLVSFLSGRQYAEWAPRGQIFSGPTEHRWTKPSIVVVNEGNYSDGHMFPWAYSVLKIGKLVGMPVPGTGTFVWSEELHTGDMWFEIPQIGVRGQDGKFLENNQLEPDIRVNNDPASVAKGEDRQLARAVRALLAQLDASKNGRSQKNMPARLESTGANMGGPIQ